MEESFQGESGRQQISGKGPKYKITPYELEIAKRKFFREGGLIQKLAPQPNPLRNLVGEQYSGYETIGISSDFNGFRIF